MRQRRANSKKGRTKKVAIDLCKKKWQWVCVSGLVVKRGTTNYTCIQKVSRQQITSIRTTELLAE